MQAQDGLSEVARQLALSSARAAASDAEAAFRLFEHGLDRLKHTASRDIIWDLAAAFHDAAESIQSDVETQLDEAGVGGRVTVDLSNQQAKWAAIIAGRRT